MRSFPELLAKYSDSPDEVRVDVRPSSRSAVAIVPEIRRDGGGAEPVAQGASIRTNPEARARIQAIVERRRALRRLAPQLLRVVPLGDDSVEFGPVDLGHDPRIHLLLAEVGWRHHAERRIRG